MFSSIANLMEQSTFERFYKVTAVLEKFVAAAPRPVGLDGIVRELEMSVSEVTAICRLLQDAGLLCPSTCYEHWVLTKVQNAVTLEDVWSSLSMQSQWSTSNDLAESSCLVPETDLLVTQAFMQLHQNIRRLLRQFQLDRVSVSKSGGLAYFSRNRRNAGSEEAVAEI